MGLLAGRLYIQKENYLALYFRIHKYKSLQHFLYFDISSYVWFSLFLCVLQLTSPISFLIFLHCIKYRFINIIKPTLEVLVPLLSSISTTLILFAIDFTFLALFTCLAFISILYIFLLFWLDAILTQTYANLQLLTVLYHWVVHSTDLEYMRNKWQHSHEK